MKWSFTLFLSLILIIFGKSLQAQVACEYRLELFDSFGDGWNGSVLTVTLNGVPATYTLNNNTDNGEFNSFSLSVMDGDEVVFSYAPGAFEGEVSYAFIDPDGMIVFEDGPNPEVGDEVFSAVLSCPSCPVPPPSSVSIDDVRAFIAGISWTPSDPEGTYLVEYDSAGFEPGNGEILEATGSSATISGLEENTPYDFYLSVACANGDTSNQVGPYSFTTLWAKDVGVSNILTPSSQCGLGSMDTVNIILQNFGGNPQSLIPFNFSVNDIPAGVPQPIDGFFTGVLGKDSTFAIPFETTFDFSEPNEYVIRAWTDLEEDSDLSNDTFSVKVVNIPIVTEYPYFTDFEDWSGGWTVGEDSENPSWAFGQPIGMVINEAASGANAWVTNLEGPYNNDELSYLVSPCLDFSEVEEAPRLAFSINFESESCCDEAWVEYSENGGETWEKIEGSDMDNNWYNNVLEQYWNGDGGFDGWVTAFTTLDSLIGEPNSRIRFVFNSDFSITREGMGIDDVFISPPLDNDLAALMVDHTADLECGDENDEVLLSITNLGNLAQTGFDVSYQVNGGPVVTENVGDFNLEPNEEGDYTFNLPFDSSEPGSYEIVAWTSLPGELFAPNDTARLTFVTAQSIPFAEDFEEGTLPEGWATDDGFVNDGHMNTSFVLSDNLWSVDPVFEATTPVLGAVEAGDSLFFDYRFVNFSGGGEDPRVLTPGDSLIVQISSDCGLEYQTVIKIDDTNHLPTNQLARIGFPLDEYTGQTIKIRFFATWAEGDFWIDIDNVNIKRCPPALGLTAEVTDATGADVANGVATVLADEGLEPFTFIWSNGATGPTIDSLAAGDYMVTVFDAVGCSEVIDLTVGVMVATEDVPSRISKVGLAPNPTSGLTTLNVQFVQPLDARIQVINTVGQVLFERFERRVARAEYQLDLTRHPAGLYLIRVVVEDEVKTRKLIRSGF